MHRQDLLLKKLPKGHNSSKNQSSMTSIKYDHLQVKGTITGKFHQNPLKTVGGDAETRLCLRTDGWPDGRTHYYSPLRLTSGDNNRFLIVLSFHLDITMKYH